MAQVMVNFCMDEELKKSMEETCKDLGLSMTVTLSREPMKISCAVNHFQRLGFTP